MCVCVCARVWAQCVPRRGPLGLLTRTGTAAMHCTSVETDTRFILIRKRLAPKRRERIVTVRCVVSQKTAYIVFERRHFSCTRYLTTCAVGKEVFWESRCVTQGLCITLRGVPSYLTSLRSVGTATGSHSHPIPLTVADKTCIVTLFKASDWRG